MAAVRSAAAEADKGHRELLEEQLLGIVPE